MAKDHGNLNSNNELHHLYEIYDKEEEVIYKYGISYFPIDSDGLSQRLREQIALFNRVANSDRFVGRILIKNIKGRIKSK